mmetsp:Transcript_30971/g.68624  ORF Transcript_30971/g.68624 Transcript_30971/m.68624 type:complete len:715 (+) Transcript_30971:172-2316(+)
MSAAPPTASLQAAVGKVLTEQQPSETCRDTLAFTQLVGALSESLFASDVDQRANTPYAGYGVKSSQGSRPHMEDSYSVQEKLSSPSSSAIDVSPSANSNKSTVTCGAGLGTEQGPIDVPFLPEDLSWFSVYDGHGGNDVAQHCSDRLHKHFAAQLALHRPSSISDNSSEGGPGTLSIDEASGPESPSPGSFLVSSSSAPAVTTICNPEMISDALRASFHKTDEELAGTEAGEFVGATAVVAVVGKDRIWVAHCGDSRAVIQRSGEAIPLTRDHKPDREDEAERVRAAGGRIVYNSGGFRIMGMLAMSRAIGDHFLRPYVIAEPEVTCVERMPEDEALVIATDGLWDVFNCKEATNLAWRCISRSKERGMSRHGACRVAASVLTKVAMERGSRDNITVIVVDITPPPDSAPQNQAVPSSATLGTRKMNKTSSFSLGSYFWLKANAHRGYQRQQSAPNVSDSTAQPETPPKHRKSRSGMNDSRRFKSGSSLQNYPPEGITEANSEDERSAGDSSSQGSPAERDTSCSPSGVTTPLSSVDQQLEEGGGSGRSSGEHRVVEGLTSTSSDLAAAAAVDAISAADTDANTDEETLRQGDRAPEADCSAISSPAPASRAAAPAAPAVKEVVSGEGASLLPSAFTLVPAAALIGDDGTTAADGPHEALDVVGSVCAWRAEQTAAEATEGEDGTPDALDCSSGVSIVGVPQAWQAEREFGGRV